MVPIDFVVFVLIVRVYSTPCIGGLGKCCLITFCLIEARATSSVAGTNTLMSFEQKKGQSKNFSKMGLFWMVFE